MHIQGRRKLLVADDSPTVQKVVSLTFVDEGLEVVVVSSGAAALAEIERGAPDILLADVHMPAPGGYEVCAHVKRDERTRRVPVVLLVGAFEPFDQAEARRCGADEVLTKPFQSIRELVNKVGVLLGAQPEAKPTDGHADANEEDGAAGELRPTAAPAARAATAERAEATDADGARASAGEPAQAVREESSSAPAFADFDYDDADIEAATPDEFAARSREHEEVAAEFAEAPAPHGFAAAASAPASASAPQPAPFDAGSADDEALLDLGDVDSPRALADDFVLDIDDDADTYVPQRAATPVSGASVHAGATAYDAQPTYTPARSYSAEPAYEEETPAAVEMQSAGSVSMAEPSVAWVAAEELSVSPEAVTEPVAAPARGLTETSKPMVSDETDRAARAAQEPESQTSPRSQTQPGAVELSPETIDAIARRVVEQLSERVVREIAWEVVPDLAERLIKRKLEEESARQ